MKCLDPKKFDKYLPIGSVVMLKNGVKTLMIVGYQRKDDKGKLYDYIAEPFPEGILSIELLRLFNHDEISLVMFLGCVNKSYAQFDAYLKEKNNDYKFFEK